MRMNSNRIENIAVTKVSNESFQYSRLYASIPIMDKTPSWDGEIWVYEDYTQKKDKLKGKVPVQVKGTQVSRFSDGERRFRLENADLENYIRSGGALFFVVEIINPNQTKIFYNSLLPVDIRDILQDMKGNKTIQSTFYELPSGKLESICMNFIYHSQKQGYSLIMNPKYRGFETVTGSVIASSTVEFRDYLLEFGTYLYGKIDAHNVDVPLQRVDVIKIFEKDNINIGVNGTVYYTEFIREINKNEKVINFGESFQMNFPNEKATTNINFKEKGTLDQRIKDCRFMLEIVKNKSLEINSNILPLNFDESLRDKISSELPNYIKELLEFKETFKRLIISLKSDLGDTIKADLNKLRVLRDIIIHKKVDNRVFKESVTFHLMKIGDLKIILARGTGKYNNELFNFFDYHQIKEKFRILVMSQDKMEETEHSPYLLIDAKELFSCNNLNVNSVEKSLLSVDYSNEFSYTVTNAFLLDVLSYYDKQNKINGLLDMAYNVFAYLEQLKEDNLLYFLNKMQVIKRKRIFTEKEIRTIISRKNEGNYSSQELCAFHILLGNKLEFEFQFNKLNKKEQEAFKSYPIYNLGED